MLIDWWTTTALQANASVASHDALSTTKTIVDIVSGLVSTSAIIIGGALAWRRWGRERPTAIRSGISHEIFVARLGHANLLIQVAVRIENRGSVPLHLNGGNTVVHDAALAAPSAAAVATKMAESGTEILWPVLLRRDYCAQDLDLTIDSQEEDYVRAEFVLPAANKVICVRTELTLNDRARDTKWVAVTFLDIPKQLAAVAHK